MKQVLTETVSEVKPLVNKKSNEIYFEGIFGLAGRKNLNGRLYPFTVMEKAIKDYNDNFITKRRALGELDHPEDASVNLRNAAFVIEEPLKLNEKGEVLGKARILEDTPMGKIAASLMRQGITIGLSSRGLGEIAEKEILDEETGEKMMVNEVSDFSIASFDLVSEPSIGKFVSQSKQQEEAVKKPEEKKIEEKKKLDMGKLVSLGEILFEE
jgi:hypothetical protein